MSTEAIAESVLIREYTRELHNHNAALFAGAGLSMPSGYLDWKALLTPIIRDLGLDPASEHDLVTVAQYHCNQSGGNKGRLTQTIFDAFSKTREPTANHRILAQLPILTYWTTNYDKLIEKALEAAKKVPDVKYTLKQLAVTRLDRDVAVYKMHGDVEHAADAVISKDDYEEYPLKMGAFVSALRGDLIEKTFLFLGFSFTDPNIDYILSRVRILYERHQRHHYCIQKAVEQQSRETRSAFRRRQLRQDYFIRDLKRFGIQTVLVDDFHDVTRILQEIAAAYKRSSILISGAAAEYGAWSTSEAEQFLHALSHQIAARKNRIVTGFGLGVGSAIINGALEYLNESGKTISDEDLVMRPFPQVAIKGRSLEGQWTEYRKSIIGYVGIALFVFGNRRNAAGVVAPSTGVRQEFELCAQAGVQLLPIGATGFMAAELWQQVWTDFGQFYPNAKPAFRRLFKKLGDMDNRADELLPLIDQLLNELQGG